MLFRSLWHFPEVFSTFEQWLEPVFASEAAHEAVHEASHDTSMEWTLMFLSVGLAIAAISLAYRFYVQKPAIPESIRQASGPLYTAMLNKWYVDAIYDFLLGNGLCKGGGTLLG